MEQEKPGPDDGQSRKKSAPAYDERRMKRRRNGKNSLRWPFFVLAITFVTSFAISFLSELALSDAGVAVSIVVVVAIIAVSITFDAIGTAAASCSAEPFLAMASRKIKGAKRAVSLVKNNAKVSSICADIIGDICGIVSGACGVGIAAQIFAELGPVMGFFGGIIVSSIIAALTVGGKAFCKKLAIYYNQNIIFAVAKLMSVFSKN